MHLTLNFLNKYLYDEKYLLYLKSWDFFCVRTPIPQMKNHNVRFTVVYLKCRYLLTLSLCGVYIQIIKQQISGTPRTVTVMTRNIPERSITTHVKKKK